MDKGKHGFALTIVERMGKGKGKPTPSYDSSADEGNTANQDDSGSDDNRMAEESAAGDLMSAMKSGDKTAFLDAFKSLMELCNY